MHLYGSKMTSFHQRWHFHLFFVHLNYFVRLGMMKLHNQHQPVAAINQLRHSCPQKDVEHLTVLLNQVHIVEVLDFLSSPNRAVVA